MWISTLKNVQNWYNVAVDHKRWMRAIFIIKEQELPYINAYYKPYFYISVSG